MKNHQTKRRTHRRNSDSNATFPAAIASIIRGAHQRAEGDLHGPCARPIAALTLPYPFPRKESSAPAGMHALARAPTRQV